MVCYPIVIEMPLFRVGFIFAYLALGKVREIKPLRKNTFNILYHMKILQQREFMAA
jgi:hypothetical protein